MSSLVSNLNEILEIKEEIKDVIGTESDLFSEYPQLISNAIATGGQADLSYYVSKDELSACSYITMDDVSACGYVTATDLNNASYITIEDIPEIDLSSYVTITQLDSMSYATTSYVDDAIAAIVFPDPDLSAYVTRTELSNIGYVTIDTLDSCGYMTRTDLDSMSYVTKVELTNASYVTETYMFTYLSQWGQSGTYNLVDRVEGLEDKTTQLDNRTAYVESYILSYDTRIQNLENAGYVTQTSLSSNSYASTTYVIDKFNEITGQITATDKDIIPSESNTYTLGDSTHLYSCVYTSNIDFNSATGFRGNSNNSFFVCVNSNNRYVFANEAFFPYAQNRNLGSSTYHWAYTYTNYLILNGQNAYTMFVTQDDLASRGFLTQHQDLSAYATIAYVTSKVPEEIDLSLYPTYTYLYSYVGAVVGDIETLLANI